jgi:serine/threonine-protein kinase
MNEVPDSPSTALAGRYAIERELGAGGMATVYLAHDLKHDRKVALKVLRPELAAALGAERFLREITTTANLRHPHILPLYDSGRTGGGAEHAPAAPADFLYYVMPYVEGESLRDRLRREKQLPMDDALAIAREVADALSYAHSRGVIHRDIKPENILLDSGHAVVADFGIARAVDAAGGRQLTETGLAIGTPTYMSPEQAAGERDIDGRSDLYALGCVLYEMLAGQPPFTGPTVESVVHQHLTADAPPITQLRPAVPAEVAGVLQRALAKNPADRFNPVAQFGDALRRPGFATAPPSAASATARATRLPVALTVVVVVIIAGWLSTRALRTGDAGAGTIERIAVLPLDNATGDSTQAFFADGMTRELIGVLTDAGVRVLGHRAVAAYRNSTLSAAEIAEALGVDAIVTGAVLQAGDVVQVAAELTDPATGENLWSRTFSRPAPDVVTLQHEVALEIARGIRARLTPDQERALGTAQPVNPKAYAQYLLGEEQANLRTPEGFRRSVEYLTRSIALDSTFAPAWATLAITNAVAIFFQTTSPDSARAVIEQASARALALDDQLGDPLIARGMMHFLLDWDFATAAEEFRLGMARHPTTLAQAVYSWFPWETGQFDEAIAVASRLIDLEPTTAQWHSDVGWDYWSSGDRAAARRSALRAIALDSAFYEPYHMLAWIEAEAGNIVAARQAADRAAAVAGGDFWLLQTLDAYIKVRAGDTAGARDVLRAMDRDPRLAQRALLLHAIGDPDSMYVLFERAIDARDPDAIWILNSAPPLRPLRHEPRYQALLERMGLPEELRR